VYLQVVFVELAYGNNIVRTYGLLDSGSQSTLIRKDVAKQLELSGQEQNLNISTINDKGKALKVMETSLKVNSIANDNSITIDVTLHMWSRRKTSTYLQVTYQETSSRTKPSSISTIYNYAMYSLKKSAS